MTKALLCKSRRDAQAEDAKTLKETGLTGAHSGSLNLAVMLQY